MKDLFSLTQTPKGKKPIGYEIDWSHPLTKGLKLKILLGANNNDLVSGILPYALGDSYQSVRGDFYASDADINGFIDYDNAEMPDISGGFTVIFDLIMDHAHDEPSGYFRTIIDTNQNASDGFRVFHTHTGGKAWRFRLVANGVGVNLDFNTKNFAIGDRVHLACSWDTQTMRLYEDGVFLNSAAHTGTLSDVTSRDWRVGMIVGGSATAESAKSFFKSFDIYDRALTDKELKLHSQDPYQFLKPASLQDAVYSALFGTSGTATIAAHVMHYFKQMRQ